MARSGSPGVWGGGNTTGSLDKACGLERRSVIGGADHAPALLARAGTAGVFSMTVGAIHETKASRAQAIFRICP
ncbi:MAG: hypothetical protein DMG08_30185 [Acidobacteria bacterium]|nr:MAG: hypothetical protein DMG08_30185 [Acidobacteriota bacterium]